MPPISACCWQGQLAACQGCIRDAQRQHIRLEDLSPDVAHAEAPSHSKGLQPCEPQCCCWEPLHCIRAGCMRGT